MRPPFVVRLDPTSFDGATSSSPPGENEREGLKQLWNAWNGKVRGLFDQGSRIENLYWRRWHMDQRQGHEQHAPPIPQNFPHDLSASIEAVESRRATEDLEAFLRSTLQAAQPAGQAALVHQPPTFALPPSRSTGPAPQPALPPPIQSSFQPPVLHAPQPQSLAFNPSPERGYSSLPSASQPPVPAGSTAPQNRIIATPSWTALISDPGLSANIGSSVLQADAQRPLQPSQQPPALPSSSSLGYPLTTPAPLTPADPFVTAAGIPTYGMGTLSAVNHPIPAPVPSPSFTLPPTATLFSDLPSALSSAPPTAIPPAFFSSYGMYQPVVAPYPRFLTPSPEPSILGELELELGPTTGEFDPSMTGPPAPPPEPDGMDSVWKDLEACTAEEAKQDPFEGLSLAQMRSRANSLEAIDRDAATRFEAYGVNAGGASMAEQAAREVAEAARTVGCAAGGHMMDLGSVVKGKRKADDEATAGLLEKKTKGACPDGLDLADMMAGSANGVNGGTKLGAGGKKNRNPHSTQLPGSGPRRQQKEEGSEGHDGPICSHCASITTPLWRRGPDDELLCNACGLYLKLHGKNRPKTFGKNNGSKRSSNGAAAQAAASGVPPSCNNCGATSTPMWRKDPEGRLCCNACSLYYKLHKVPRPASLAQKRKAAAAAKANLAAASAAAAAGLPPPPPIDPNAELPSAPPNSAQPTASPSGLIVASHVEQPAAVNPHALPAPPAGTLQSLPPLPPTFQLPPPLPAPPTQPHNQPGGPPVMHHPPVWPFPPPGYIPPGYLPPGFSPLPGALLQHPHGQPLHPSSQPPNFSFPGAIPAPLPPSPFAQTAWGALAYGIVSAAAAEEAGGGQRPPSTGGQFPQNGVPP